jgi:2-methylcitrate dehydratase PrpD
VTLARELVGALRAAAKQPLPEKVARAAQLHFADALGVGLAAAGSSVGAPYVRYAAQASSGPASVFGRSSGATAAEAALVNGGLIHSLEFDDTHTASIAHGSSVLAATALAAGEAAGAGGAALLGAYARGWEVLIRFGLASPGRFQARGFQITSVGGALAAALVASELNALTEDETVAALGISLSQASGVLEFLTNGSSVKSLHPGWAAHGGVVAATLAKAGMTGPETSLEGRFGLFRQFAGDEQAAGRLSVKDIGTTWHLPDAAFKFYPCCHYLHPFIEAAGEIRGDGKILCRVPAGAAPVICEPWEAKQAPGTPHAARWSLPIVVATRIVEGKVDLGTFERPASPAVLAAANRISWEPLEDARFPERFEAEIECGGRTVRIDDVYGNTSRPASPDAVRAKFLANGGNDEIWNAVHAGRPARDIGAALRHSAKKEATIS